MGWTITIAVFLAICVGAMLGWAFKRPVSPLQANEETVRLSIPPDALNMGAIWEDDHFSWTVPIENHETVAVEIKSFSTTCNCLSIEPQSFVLGPGERRELRLQIDLTSQTKPTGEVAVRLWPQLKAKAVTELSKQRAPEWTVTGRVRRVLTLNHYAYLGRHSELAQPLPAWTIPIEILSPLKSLSAQCDSVSFAATVERSQEGKAILRLTSISHPLPIGEFQGTVRLKPVRKGGEALPTREMRFSGKIVPDVEAVPPAVQVGGRHLSETFEETVVLRSMTGRTLAAAHAEAEGEELSVETIEESRRFRIRQKVCRVGQRTNHVRFYIESGGHPVVITVPVSYTGIESR